MSQPFISLKDVQKAHAGVITTPMLHQIRRHAHAVKSETITEEGATLLLLCAPALFDELLEYRLQREASLDLPPPDAGNVVQLRDDV